MEEGQKIQLKNQEVEVVKCGDCGKLMVNIDANQLAVGDLLILKKAGVLISNPDTEDAICLNCEAPRTFRSRVNDFFSSDNSDDDDDSSFFGGSSSTFGGFGGGSSFGGFGGGSFGGGGASAGF